MFQWNVYYEANFGFLVFYGNVRFDDFSFTEATATLEETNINRFLFLGGMLNSPLVRPLFILGIVIELVVVGRLIFRRGRT